MSSTYVERAIDVSVKLGQGSFGDSGSTDVKLSGLRTVASIQKLGPPGAASADIRIYGVQRSIMNQISTLGVPLPMARLNTVTIEAGDSVSGMAAVYTGIINNAWQMLDDMPETFLDISAITGYLDAMAPVPPLSFPGSADVATIMSGLAVRMGRAFENNGVTVTLSNQYFSGTALEQAHECARAANIEMTDDGYTLAIWPRLGTRGGVKPLISAASGLIGYPRYTGQGVAFRTLFNPSIQFGGMVTLQSDMQPANGDWYVNGLNHDLSSQMPGGPWFTDCEAVRQPGSPK